MLVLASSSPARRRLLRQAGISFAIVPPRVREIKGRGRTLGETVLENALRKAREVSRRCPGRWILAADTLIEFQGRIYGKPPDRKRALEVLTMLSGRTHRLATAVVLRRGSRAISRVVRSEVTLRSLPRARIARTLRHPERLAGGYAIRKGRDPVVERIQGSFTNVVGLPMEQVLPLLGKLGLSPRRG